MTVPSSHPPTPEPQEPAPQEPLAVTPPPQAAKETWIDEPDGQPPALGSEVHGELQKRLEGLNSARRPSLLRRWLNALFGKRKSEPDA